MVIDLAFYYLNMKANLRKLIFFAALMLMAGFTWAQPWMSQFENTPNPNFFQIQKAFNDYWSAKGMDDSIINRNDMNDDEAGDFGEYIQYKRWEWFNVPRVSPTGDFPNPMIAYNERNNLRANRERRRNLQSLAANWTCIGPVPIPNKGGEGRLNCIAINPLDSNNIYVGSPSGGIWKTNNGGSTWAPTGDYLATLGVSDIAIDPTDTNIIYIATGDGDVIYTYSTGVMKSTNGGATWATTGLNWQTNQGLYMNRIVINPNNHNMILVGHYNGISKSVNGGATWTNSITGHRIFDIQFKPANPAIVYASSYKTIYRSADSGSTFTTVYSTLGANRIELAVTSANANYLYAIESDSATSGFHALVRSIDGGNSFTQMSNTPNILDWSPLGVGAGGQGWADLAIIASPIAANTIFIGGINIWKSTDGGTTWTNKTNGSSAHTNTRYVHADIHKLTFIPGNPSSVLSVNDGGIFKSTDTATTWTDLSAGLTIMEMYDISSGQTNAAFVSCGVQDNGSNLYNNGAWAEDVPGDGMVTIVDYTNANTIYTTQYDGKISISTNGGTNFTVITPNGGSVTGAWVTPFVIDKNVHTTLYGGYNDVWKTTNQGTSWTQISNNLTGNSSYLIMAMALAPSNSNYLYVALGPNTGYNNIPGTSIYRTANGGTTWSNITGSLPVGSAYISAITVKANDPQTVWVTFSGYNSTYKIYKTTNGGTTWVNVTANLPNVPVDCIVYDKASNADRVFIGTDIGVFYTDTSQSGSWVSFNSGLPDVMVFSLDIQDSAALLRAGTFGRGAWQTRLTAASCPTINVTATQIGTSTSAYATASGGAMPYAYVWNTVPAQSTDTASSLTVSSTYTVTVTDHNGCTGTASVTITAASCPTINVTATQIGTTTSAFATVSGGATPYTYAWSTVPAQSTDTASALTVSSTYTVTVTDHNGCTGTASVTITAASCPTINVTATQIGNTTSAFAAASGGATPYTYVWNTVPAQSTDTANALTANSTYTVTVTDHNGCTGAASVTIAPASCPAINVTATQIGNTTSAFATVSGGATPYTYVWNTIPIQTTDTAMGLTTGNYSVSVTDHNGCTGTANLSVTVSTGITTTSDITKFSIYPNPSPGLFTVYLHLVTACEVTFTVSDVTGNKIYESTDNGLTDLIKPIHLETIAAGIYFVNVKTAGSTVNKRIVIR